MSVVVLAQRLIAQCLLDGDIDDIKKNVTRDNVNSLACDVPLVCFCRDQNAFKHMLSVGLDLILSTFDKANGKIYKVLTEFNLGPDDAKYPDNFSTPYYRGIIFPNKFPHIDIIKYFLQKGLNHNFLFIIKGLNNFDYCKYCLLSKTINYICSNYESIKGTPELEHVISIYKLLTIVTNKEMIFESAKFNVVSDDEYDFYDLKSPLKCALSLGNCIFTADPPELKKLFENNTHTL
jgi:hypothetical protein